MQINLKQKSEFQLLGHLKHKDQYPDVNKKGVITVQTIILYVTKHFIDINLKLNKHSSRNEPLETPQTTSYTENCLP